MKQTVRGMILGCTLAAALVLTGCMNSNSGANSASQSHSTSGTASGSGASQTEDRSGWRTGMSVLTEMTGQDENGKLNTITAAVVLDGEGRIRDVQLDELELTVTAHLSAPVPEGATLSLVLVDVPATVVREAPAAPLVCRPTTTIAGVPPSPKVARRD